MLSAPDRPGHSSAVLGTETVDAPSRRLADLRARIRQIETGAAISPKPPEPPAREQKNDTDWLRTLQIAGIEPNRQPPALTAASLQEVVPAAAKDRTPAAAFALALIRQLNRAIAANSEKIASRPLLWCQKTQEAWDFGRFYPPGLGPWKIAPEQLLLVETRRDKDVLWAMEEGLRSRAVAAVVGELGTADLTATRRLALAAQQSGCACLLLRNGGTLSASAARTRWRIAGAPSLPGVLDPKAPGRPSWQAELARCPQGRPGAWILEWSHETDSFRLAAAVADRPAAARQAHRAA